MKQPRVYAALRRALYTTGVDRCTLVLVRPRQSCNYIASSQVLSTVAKASTIGLSIPVLIFGVVQYLLLLILYLI